MKGENNMKMYVPFAYEKYGRIEVDADSKEKALKRAEELLDRMSVSDMEALSDYLQGSQEIDDEGIVLDENGNILDD